MIFLIDQVSKKITFMVEKCVFKNTFTNCTKIIAYFRKHALTPEIKVFVTYLSTGSILQVTADFNGIDKSTASLVLGQVTRLFQDSVVLHSVSRLTKGYLLIQARFAQHK